MGNAAWTGVRLKDVLAKAGLHKETVEIVVNGADGPVNDKTPDFVKSIPIWKALDENTIIAVRMNGEPLPHFNGFPARLVVPGWTGTYWMKHLVTIEAATKPFAGFWMKSAYRIPNGKFPIIERFLSQGGQTMATVDPQTRRDHSAAQRLTRAAVYLRQLLPRQGRAKISISFAHQRQRQITIRLRHTVIARPAASL